MKNISHYLTVFSVTFFLGLIIVFAWYFQYVIQIKQSNKSVIKSSSTISYKPDDKVKKKSENITLDDYWEKAEKFSYKGYTITKYCSEIEYDEACQLRLQKNGKILQEFTSDKKYRLEYGFFNFFGGKDKQLILFNREGGSSTTDIYVIYDLKQKPEILYDSRKYNKELVQVNYDLIPVDIDKDGIYEFTQSVMAFVYISPGGKVTSTIPPAIFAYNSKTKTFELANKKFSNYVLEKMREKIDGLEDWAKENEKLGTYTSQKELDEIAAREKSLHLIYAGKEKEGWKYFEENYNFEFKNEFRSDIKDSLRDDPTYKSIYSKNSR